MTNVTYGKCPKISNTLFHTILAYILLFMQLFLNIHSGIANSVNPYQTALMRLLFMQLFLKILSGIGNSVDPDQTLLQRQSYLGLYRMHILFCQKLWFRNFRTITDLEI